jgi:hypothetical protein
MQFNAISTFELTTAAAAMDVHEGGCGETFVDIWN